VTDLLVVVEYLKTHFGYVIDLVVGHSRGSVVGMHWICTSEEGRNVSGFVNASGRYRMAVSSTHIPPSASDVNHSLEFNDSQKILGNESITSHS
jgi:hypothetical protein